MVNAPNNWIIHDDGQVPDYTNPVITSTHNNQTINCEQTLPDYTGNVTATDNCDNDLDITQIPTAGTTISGAINEITLTATDDAGNFAEVTFNVEVVDNTDPEITSTHNTQQVDANANCEAILLDYTGDVTATDNCDNNLDITQNPTAGSSISGTTNEIILTATDDAGNSDEVTFNVEVVDNTIPTISCIENQNKQLLESETVYTVSGTEFDPTATDDNCEIATVINDFNSSTTLESAEFPIGSTTVIWTITDNAGNPANCSFTFK